MNTQPQDQEVSQTSASAEVLSNRRQSLQGRARNGDGNCLDVRGRIRHGSRAILAATPFCVPVDPRHTQFLVEAKVFGELSHALSPEP